MLASYENDKNNYIAGNGLQKNARLWHNDEYHSQFMSTWFFASRNITYDFYSTYKISDPRMTERWNHFVAPMEPQ